MKGNLVKDYLHTFKIPFILLGILLVITLVLKASSEGEDMVYVRTNHEAPKERVFDKADVLTKEEEERLREKIAEAESKIGADIIIVILEESLKEYAESYESIIGPVDPSEYVMVYADNFYDEHQFGFDRPVGDGILLLDNWFREEDGGLYSWISTCGKVYEHYSSGMISALMDDFIEAVQIDPASGYELFVEQVERELSPNGGSDNVDMPGWMVFAIAGVSALIFFFVNYGGRKGKKTVEAYTYVRSGRPEIRVKEDQYLSKTVTKRRIEQSSGDSGGGGGGHISAGGHTHGGGGGRR